jgi:EAL domain-containing protein (putative c-di-GMP-specific phosphodiesterase class I)
MTVNTLQSLGVEQAQGYFPGRPMPLEKTLQSIEMAQRRSSFAA